MKTLLFIFSLALFQGFSNEDYTIKSKINNVVVYQQGAQINRTGTYTVRKGITELHITGISSQINPQTLQIKASGNIVILDSKHNRFYPEPEATSNQNLEVPLKVKRQINTLKDSLFELSFELNTLKNEISVLQNEKRIIENNGTIKGVGKVNDSIPLLKDALTFYHNQMNKINASILNLSRKEMKFNKLNALMKERLNELENYSLQNKPVSPQSYAPIDEIIITVSAKEYVSGTLKVSYLVNGAGWTPLYDIRSNGNQETIELTYKAQVYQNTGINWENTSLSVSTNNPYTNKTKPTLKPWYLAIQNNSYNSIPQPQYQREAKKTEAFNQEEITDDELSFDYEETSAIHANQFMTMIDQSIAVEYKIDLPYTIKSDNQKNMVLVKQATLKSEYTHYTAPKLDKSVYLIAQVTNLDELNLIPGTATIFHDGTYLGNTYLNPTTLSDTLDLSLGRATQLQVERKLLKNATKERIVGDKVEKTYTYNIEVKNHSKQTMTYILEDQIPITRNEIIMVELLEGSKGKLNEINGTITWNEKIKPGSKNNYELIFKVTYPKAQPINLALN
ncbi:DUF4139 domain-containing protein [Crocinitomix algicola]|uniref:DUF4139 domain-containing protein n=1 Tax=Crocinitomix algicola TaxID=1740263 RepID=UPI0008349026|nr:DUF4139 domain-containing protein [Crocinitomix algicola]